MKHPPYCHMQKGTRVLSSPLPAPEQHGHADRGGSAASVPGPSSIYPIVFSRAAPPEGPGGRRTRKADLHLGKRPG